MGWGRRQTEALRPGAGYRGLGRCGILHHVLRMINAFRFLLERSGPIHAFKHCKALISADDVIYTKQPRKTSLRRSPPGAYFFEVSPGNRQTGACNPRNRQWQARRVIGPRRKRPSSPPRRTVVGQRKLPGAQGAGACPRPSPPAMTGQRVKELTRE